MAKKMKRILMNKLHVLYLLLVVAPTAFAMEKEKSVTNPDPVTRYEGTNDLGRYIGYMVHEESVEIRSNFYLDENSYGAHAINEKNGHLIRMDEQAENLYKKHERQWQAQVAADKLIAAAVSAAKVVSEGKKKESNE